jgi:hypothetical protein
MGSKKRSTAVAKRNLVVTILTGGGTQAEAARAVKTKFGSGIASRDISKVMKNLQGHPSAGAPEDFLAARAPNPRTPTAKETSMRRFVLDRSFDATGTSGTGVVAEGVQFSSGHVVIHWLSQLEAINVYGNAMVLEQLHGHNGSTVIKWLDEGSR